METRTRRVQDQGRNAQEAYYANLQKLSVIAVVITLLLTHCTTAPIKPVSETPKPVPSVTPMAGLPQLQLGNITGASVAEVLMINTGFDIANRVARSNCFKQAVLSGNFTEVDGKTDSQVWATITFKPYRVDVDMYSGSWSANHISHTIGYEDEPGMVHMNRYFVDTAYMVADNAIHEGLGHSAGFTHYSVKETSEPYRLNQYFEKCAAQMGISEDE